MRRARRIAVGILRLPRAEAESACRAACANHEWTEHETFADLEAARLSVFKYIETSYNPVRLHQTLGYKSPQEFEAEYAPVLAA